MFGHRKTPEKLHVYWKVGDPVLTPDGPGEIRGFADADAHGPGRGQYRWGELPVDGPFVVLLTNTAVPNRFRGYVYDQLAPRAGNERKWPGAAEGS